MCLHEISVRVVPRPFSINSIFWSSSPNTGKKSGQIWILSNGLSEKEKKPYESCWAFFFSLGPHHFPIILWRQDGWKRGGKKENKKGKEERSELCPFLVSFHSLGTWMFKATTCNRDSRGFGAAQLTWERDWGPFMAQIKEDMSNSIWNAYVLMMMLMGEKGMIRWHGVTSSNGNHDFTFSFSLFLFFPQWYVTTLNDGNVRKTRLTSTRQSDVFYSVKLELRTIHAQIWQYDHKCAS